MKETSAVGYTAKPDHAPASSCPATCT